MCRLRFFGKLARTGEDKLLKQVFRICKPLLENMPTTRGGGTRKLLFDLHLGEVWSSESVDSSKEWEKRVLNCIRGRELQMWREGIQKKAKLRLYRTLKSDLRREEYLSLPLESRRRLTEI